MKRTVLSLAISLCLLFFTSCAPAGGAHLNPLEYGESFREKNEILFPNRACGHALIQTPLTGNTDPSVSSIYHQTSCKWGGCDYEAHNEPHVFLFDRDEIPTARAYYKEDGCLYHSFNMACNDCHGAVTLHVRCQTQNTDCGAGEGSIHALARCFEHCDWARIFGDTPYRIVIRSDGNGKG